MVQHRKNLHIDVTRRTEAALDVLETSGAAMTFKMVAKRAGVSRSWLYKAGRTARPDCGTTARTPRPARNPAERASDVSKEAVIRTLRQRLADERTAKPRLADENKRLRKINELLAGQVHCCRTYHTTNAAISSDYSRIVYRAPATFEAATPR